MTIYAIERDDTEEDLDEEKYEDFIRNEIYSDKQIAIERISELAEEERKWVIDTYNVSHNTHPLSDKVIQQINDAYTVKKISENEYRYNTVTCTIIPLEVHDKSSGRKYFSN